MNRLMSTIKTYTGIRAIKTEFRDVTEDNWEDYKKVLLETVKASMIADQGFFTWYRVYYYFMALRPRFMANGMPEEFFADLINTIKNKRTV